MRYLSQELKAEIGGVRITFTVVFPEPITDPAKLPVITLTADRDIPFKVTAAEAKVETETPEGSP